MKSAASCAALSTTRDAWPASSTNLRKHDSPGARLAELRPQLLTVEQLLGGLHPPPPEGFLDKLHRLGLVRNRSNRLPADTAGLVHSLWKLVQLGIRLEDLRPIAHKI